MESTLEPALAEQFEPSIWDPINLAVWEMAKVLWVPARDKVLEALHIVAEVSGYPNVRRHDLDLASFVFALAETLVAEVNASSAWRNELLQKLAAHVYLRTPRGDLPDPTFYWLFLAGEATAYREAVARGGAQRKFTCIVDHFLSRYDLGGPEDPELVHGICQMIAPVIRETRQFLKLRAEPIDEASPVPTPAEGAEAQGCP